MILEALRSSDSTAPNNSAAEKGSSPSTRLPPGIGGDQSTLSTSEGSPLIAILTGVKDGILIPYWIVRGIFLSLIGLFSWVPPVRMLIEWMVLSPEVKALSKTIKTVESDKTPDFNKKESLKKGIDVALKAVKHEEDREFFYQLLVKHLIDGHLIVIDPIAKPQRDWEVVNRWLDHSYNSKDSSHQTALQDAMVSYRKYLASSY